MNLPLGWNDACEWAARYCRERFNKDWHDDGIAEEYMAARNGYLAALNREPEDVAVPMCVHGVPSYTVCPACEEYS